MLPKRMKLQIFADMPWRIRLATCLAPLCGRSAQQVMAPAVADPVHLGYSRLYRMMLDMVRLRPYVLLYCVRCTALLRHGKSKSTA